MVSRTVSIFSSQTAQKGKRERTRSALLDSAVSVLADKGFAGAKITDITNHAGLANGTFYNYYKDKDELIRDVGLQLAIEFAGRVDEQMADVTDAVERVTLATARVLFSARREPEWLLVLLDSVVLVPELQESATQFLRQDLQMGVTQGAFTVDVDAFLVRQILSLIRVGLLDNSAANDEAISRTCVGILQLLGLTHLQATRRVARMLVKHDLSLGKPDSD